MNLPRSHKLIILAALVVVFLMNGVSAVVVELIKRWREAVQPHLASFSWSVASGALGGVVGLGMAALWGHTVGW